MSNYDKFDNYDRGNYSRSPHTSYDDATTYGVRNQEGTYNPSAVSTFSRVMTRVYMWMTVALVLTAGAAYFTATIPALTQLVYGNTAVIWVLFIGELALVMGISMGINRLAPTTATALFLLYSLINGVTMSGIFFAYSIGAIYQAFAASALTFGGMSIFGYTVKKDLSRLGSILIMALIGIIIASIVNIFWSNSTFDAIITYLGVFLFVGLTAYDTQRIKAMSEAAEAYGDADATSRVAILGALSLYLDFINLFLYILRLFGRSRD